MIEADLFNRMAIRGNVDKLQYGFNVKQNTPQKSQTKDLLYSFKGAVKFLHIGLSESIDAEPMQKEDFDGIKEFPGMTYEQIKLVGIPYMIGVISYTVGNTVFYKLGLNVQKFKTEL